MRKAAFVAMVAAAAFGCGGGGSSGGGEDGGGISFRVFWEGREGAANGEDIRADAFASSIPRAVNTVRITLIPIGGSAASGCCIAVGRGTQTFIDRLLVLDGVEPGDHRVSLAGYATDFAPAGGAGRKCATIPSSAGSACDSDRLAAPSFGSDGVTVTVAAGERSDAGDILVYSLPFPVSLSPADGETVTGPRVDFAGVIADAVNDVNAGSIDVRMGEVGSNTAPIALDALVACDDLGGASVPACSAGRALEVRGYVVTGTSGALADGDATLNVLAANDAQPARQLDFAYDFRVGTPPSTTTTTTTSTTLPTGVTTTTTVTTASSTTTTPPGSTTSTTLGSQRSCTVVFGTDDTVDLAGVSFEVDYSAAPGDFVGSDDGVQCTVAGGLAAASAFNDQESSRTLVVGLVTGGVIAAPTNLVECEYLGSLPPINSDFAITVREAFDDTLAIVTITVDVRSIACAP